MKIELIDLGVKTDSRGWLANLTPALAPEKINHLFVATIAPGEVRGNHFHKRKTEWVMVTSGTCKVKLTDIKTGESAEEVLNADKPTLVVIPINQEVKLINNSDQTATILAIFDDVFNPADPDVFTL